MREEGVIWYNNQMSKDLLGKKCGPCEGGAPSLAKEEAESYLAEAPGWELKPDGLEITRVFKFKNFREAIAFVNKVADLAEDEGHHPDIRLYSFNKVRLNLKTHAIGGLSENDFILAAKIGQLI